MLYVIATPLGNLGDITLRALEVLRTVDVVACEDTRRTRILLTHYEIDKPLLSYYEHNKVARGAHLIELLKKGKRVALVSDSGTPGISDPGFQLVRSALENQIAVVPLPGPSALTAAVSASGMPADRFVFEGFLPLKKGARKKRLELLRSLERTIVIYESPYRIEKLLKEVYEVFGNVEIALAREMTKRFEEIKKIYIADLIDRRVAFEARGEFVLVINAKIRI